MYRLCLKGGEMGRQWYEEPDGGKYLCKKNTFNDFIDVANWLIKVGVDVVFILSIFFNI